jgi:hypothetical protein
MHGPGDSAAIERLLNRPVTRILLRFNIPVLRRPSFLSSARKVARKNRMATDRRYRKRASRESRFDATPRTLSTNRSASHLRARSLVHKCLRVETRKEARRDSKQSPNKANRNVKTRKRRRNWISFGANSYIASGIRRFSRELTSRSRRHTASSARAQD